MLLSFNRENRRCAWSKIIEMIRYPDEGRAKGKVVITVQQNNKA